jgi:hypothetical protein
VFLRELKRTEGWRKLHNDFHNLYSSSNIIRMMRSRKFRWWGHITCMGEMSNVKVKSPCFEHQAMKVYWGSGGLTRVFLTSALA